MGRSRSRSPCGVANTRCARPAPLLGESEGSTLDFSALSVKVTPDNPSSWVPRAVEIFRANRMLILMDLFSEAVTETVWKSLRELHQNFGAKHDRGRIGNRCPGRYDMASAYSTGHLTHLPGYLEAYEEFAQKGGLQFLEELGGYKFVGGGGQLCLAHTDNWQPLHSDFRRPKNPALNPLWEKPEHVPYLDLMFTVHPLTSENGAMRIIPGFPSPDETYWQTKCCPPPSVSEESDVQKRSQLYPLPAGCGIFRDIRVWHGGVPNTTDQDRHLAVLQFFSNWSLSLCDENNQGKGVHCNDIKSKLSSEAQNSVSPHIVRDDENDEPRIIPSMSQWNGDFGY